MPPNDSLADGQVATCKGMVVAAEGVVATVNKMCRLSTRDHSRSATLAAAAARHPLDLPCHNQPAGPPLEQRARAAYYNLVQKYTRIDTLRMDAL